MKKHKSHARHVFNFLEKNYGVTVVFNDDDTSSKKGGNDRKSSGSLITTGKMSSISKTSEVVTEGSYKIKAATTSSLTADKP